MTDDDKPAPEGDSENDDAPASGAPDEPAFDGGLAFRYSEQQKRKLPIAPSTGELTNTIVTQRWPSPAACVRLDQDRFAFDSSFPRATLSQDLKKLFGLRAPDDSAVEKLAVFGHADPTGDEEYNKTLAGRRAKAIYALLTRDPKMWDELHQGAYHGDRWGVESLQAALEQLGYDIAPISPKVGPKYDAAVRGFQTDQGLPSNGVMDKATRLALFGAYMDSLSANDDGDPRAYLPADFVGEGKDPDLRGAMQGCGERNPAMVLSEAESKELEKDGKHEERNRVQSVNRRVLIFLYAPEDVADLTLWECPKATAPGSACDKVKWSDKDTRLKPTERRREVRRHGKTFGCKFYDFTARLSPCEALRGTVRIWIRDAKGVKYTSPVEYELRSVNAVRKGTTDDDGRLVEENFPIARAMGVSWVVEEEAPAPSPVPDDMDDRFDSTTPLERAQTPSNESDDVTLDDDGDEPSAFEQDSPGHGGLQAPGGASAPAVSGFVDSPAAEQEGGGASSGEGSSNVKYATHTTVFLPVYDEKPQKRDLLWLQNLGYSGDPKQYTSTMAKMAMDYGLADGSKLDDQSNLLSEVQTKGREAVPPSKSDATSDAPAQPPAPAEPPAPAPTTDDPAAAGKPPCDCGDAPKIDWKPADSTFIAPVATYVDAAQRLAKMPGDLLFELPLFDGQFLFTNFKHGPRPKRDPVTKIWKRDRGDPKFSFLYDGQVRGVAAEMRNRLDWAQRRLWFRYCSETKKAAGNTTDAGFKKWLVANVGVLAEHDGLRDGMSMHSDGAAIDVGAGSAPFICMRGTDDQLYGERHDLPTIPFVFDQDLFAKDSSKTKAVQLAAHPLAVAEFYKDNAFEPAMAGFDRAAFLLNGGKAEMIVAKGVYPLEAPPESPCTEITKNTVFANTVVAAWERFNKVNLAWLAYVAPSSLDDFKTKILATTPLKTSLLIDADLIPWAESHDTPPLENTRLETVPVPADKSGRRALRRRIAVPVGELKSNEGRARAAYFQMLRDKTVAASVMVKGSPTMIAATDPSAGAVARFPCAWPSGFDISVMDTRDVTKGFLGVSKELVRAMVEAGLTWLGGTGKGNGEPIDNFTGDIMHFDLRTIHNIGSTEVDAWLEANASRKPWAATIEQVSTLLGAAPDKPKKKDETALRYLVAAKGYSPLTSTEKPTLRLQKMMAKMAEPKPLADPDLAAQCQLLLDSLENLRGARQNKQSQFAGNTDAIFDKAERALSKAFLSTSEADANQALADAKTLVPIALEEPQALTKRYADVFKAIDAQIKSIDDFYTHTIIIRKKPSTTKELDARAPALQKILKDSTAVLLQSKATP